MLSLSGLQASSSVGKVFAPRRLPRPSRSHGLLVRAKYDYDAEFGAVPSEQRRPAPRGGGGGGRSGRDNTSGGGRSSRFARPPTDDFGELDEFNEDIGGGNGLAEERPQREMYAPREAGYAGRGSGGGGGYSRGGGGGGFRGGRGRGYQPREGGASGDGGAQQPREAWRPRGVGGGEGGQTREPWQPRSEGDGEGGQAREPWRPRGDGGGEGGQTRDSWRPRGEGGGEGGSFRGGYSSGGRGGGGGGYSMTFEQRQARTEMNQRIRDALSWQELAAFVEEKGPQMDAENASQVLFRLSFKPSTKRYGSSSSRFSSNSSSSSSNARTEQTTTAFVRPTNDEAAAAEYDRLLSTLLGWVLVLMSSFRPRQVVTTLQSLAKLELWNLEVVSALVDLAIRQMGNFDAPDYGNIVWAFAKLNYAPGQAFFDAFLERGAKKLPAMMAGELSKTACGLSKLGCVPTAEWAEAFWTASAGKAYEFDALQSSDIFLAVAYFAQAGMQPPQHWVDTVFGAYVDAPRPSAAAVDAPTASSQGNNTAASDTAQSTAQRPSREPQRERSGGQSTSNQLKIQTINKLLYTLSNLTAKPSPAWFGAVTDAWRRQFSFCSPSDLGSISLYLGRYLQVPVSLDMCRALLREAMKKQGLLAADDLAAIAYLLAASQFKGGDKEVDDLVYVIKGKIAECSLSGAEMVYNALPSLGSGYRLNETVAEAANRYNDLLAQSEAQQAVAAEAAVSA
ncbi:hypothetical protein FOA52_007737 [Chlamydomonas sp. UWO 241]|nr:hypothetical protein FOA52_007737 [Chlamydomonas sp. UWO 241]